MASASALALLARPGGGHGRQGGEWAPARPSAGSLLGRLRVSSAWRGPCAALRKAAGGEGASGASTGRRAPPAAGGGPCCRVPAPWTGQGGGAAAPRPPLLAGAAMCCLVSSLLVLCAALTRLQWHCTACHGEWRAARASPRVAREAREARLSVNPAAHGRRGSCSTGCGHRCGKKRPPSALLSPAFYDNFRFIIAAELYLAVSL